MFETKLILDFLAQLKENNNKEWMDAHRAEYEQARDTFKSLVSYVLEALKPLDPGLENVAAADCIFRMNRDIRFSADKTPYKTWMSAVMAEGGRHSIQAIYYLHLQPGDESMAAGGMYQPAGEQLRKIRQEIDYNAAELQQIVSREDFKHHFGYIQGEKLSRGPKGYPLDHPNIELLKLKSFIAIRKFSDRELQQENFAEELINTYRAVQPFNEYLNIAIS